MSGQNPCNHCTSLNLFFESGNRFSHGTPEVAPNTPNHYFFRVRHFFHMCNFATSGLCGPAYAPASRCGQCSRKPLPPAPQASPCRASLAHSASIRRNGVLGTFKRASRRMPRENFLTQKPEKTRLYTSSPILYSFKRFTSGFHGIFRYTGSKAYGPTVPAAPGATDCAGMQAPARGPKNL